MSELRPLYKKLLRLAQSLPEPKRAETLAQIRGEFRSHAGATDPVEIAGLLQRAQSQLGFLKIVTPRAAVDKGVKRYIYRNGQRVELDATGAPAAEEGARWKVQDVEAGLKRHHQLLRRQHFMDRGVPPPRSIF